MQQELLKRAREVRFFRGALLEFAAELPPDDAALDQLIADAVTQRENDAFVRIVFAALGAGRRIDARHLEGGASLFDDPPQLAAAAMHLSGDVPRALIGAVQKEYLSTERNAAALLLAGVWCREHENAAVPPELIVQARIHARRAGQNLYADFQVALLSTLLQDKGLAEILDAQGVPLPSAQMVSDFISEAMGPSMESPLGIVPERPGPIVHSGYTMRRAVARIGRNDPCPCGSGRKYKKCCMQRDQARLQESSSVAGLTIAELRAQRERFLTEDELLQMRTYDMVRLDPMKLPHSLRLVLIDRLLLFGELEAAVQLFEKTGAAEDLRDHWLDCLRAVVRAQRKDLLLRLLQLRDESERQRPDFPFAAQLLLADEADVLRLIEEAALTGLKGQGRDSSIEMAYALMEGKWPALGILVGRGMIAHEPLFDAEVLFDALLETRDKLNLSPDDPLHDVLDQRFEASIETHRDSEALQKAHERLEINNQELSEARAKLVRLQAELDKKERETQPRSQAVVIRPEAPTGIDEAALSELRRRVASLKEELKERHSERNQLRGELKNALERLEELRRNEAAAKLTEEEESLEEGLLDDVQPIGTQPVRIPEFSQKFRDSLREMPPRAVRHAMSLIGRMAAGEGGAFAGIKRLKSNREIVRQRVGADHRLLFRLHATSIELLALIPRRDLERKIRSLAAG